MTEHKNNQIDYVEFPVTDNKALAHSKRFFSEVFGWSYTDWGEDYADTKSSGLGSGFNADPEHRPARPLAVLYTANLEAIREQVIEAGGIITRDIFSFPGGRRFHFTEPGGNELAVWSDQ